MSIHVAAHLFPSVVIEVDEMKVIIVTKKKKKKVAQVTTSK